MIDQKCDVCGVNPPIGVASTLLPYSCAYCAECARRFAQPMIVFHTLLEDYRADNLDLREEGGYGDMEAFVDGRYITFREWAPTQVREESEP